MTSYFNSINPAFNEKIAEYRQDTAKIIEEKINKSKDTSLIWKSFTHHERAKHIYRLSEVLLKNKVYLAEIASIEMGKPILQSISEIEKCAYTLDYYAKESGTFLKDHIIQTEAQRSFISYQPLGIVLAIMPWNFPYWQVLRAMGPILMAGNSMLLKHASNVTGCALAIEEMTQEAGFPEGLFQPLLIDSSKMESVIAHPYIDAVSFTGSTHAGKIVASTAALHLKKQVLELGGSDPYLIFKDADLGNAVFQCASSRLNNTGQSCIAAKRFIVEEEVYDEFLYKMKDVFNSKSYGNPLDEKNDLGPMARTDLRDSLHEQVLKSIELGAKLICGGFIPDQAGAFYPPTILTDVKKGMPAYDEELFGPVAAVIKVSGEEEAVAVANDSIFGLGAAIFSENIAHAEKLATKHIQAGNVFINHFVSSNPKLPFGGIRQSGYGRELSHLALQEFSNIKSISIK